MSLEKVAVLLSGGVDSSVALARLAKENRYDLTAFYLKIWLEDELSFLGDCPWEEDLQYARQVCEQLNVPLQVMSLQGAYHERVVSYTLAELRAGRTPSPDIFCNQRVKYGAFLEAVGDDFRYVASGHYARVIHDEQSSKLLKAIDPVKDQTYFLSHLRQDQLRRALFPLGEFPKATVRSMAQTYELPTQSRPDSQGICFLGKIKYRDFVDAHLGRQEGEIREVGTERLLGRHQGFWFHTIGQRKGLGLSGGPWFVAHKDIEHNVIYVAHESEAASTGASEFDIVDAHWIGLMPTSGSYEVKVRHGQNVYPCTLNIADGPRHHVTLIGHQDRGLATGQFSVFYRGDECLGGAMIEHRM